MEFRPKWDIDDEGRKRENLAETSASVEKKWQFTTENQPAGHLKSLGWLKKKKGRNLFRAIMQLPLDGTNFVPKKDKEGNDVIDEQGNVVLIDQLAIVRKQAANYFNMPEELVTVEMVIFMKQAARAIQLNDTNAAQFSVDQSYGRPKEHIEVEEVAKPEVKLIIGQDPSQLPPIAHSEAEVEATLPPEKLDSDNETFEFNKID